MALCGFTNAFLELQPSALELLPSVKVTSVPLWDYPDSICQILKATTIIFTLPCNTFLGCLFTPGMNTKPCHTTLVGVFTNSPTATCVFMAVWRKLYRASQTQDIARP